MSRKIGTEVEVNRCVSENWSVTFQAAGGAEEWPEHVRCSKRTSFYAPPVRFCGAWPTGIQNDPALAPMRAAAEQLWWENKTPGKDECRDSGRSLWQMRTAKFDGVECRFHDGKEWKQWSTVRLGYAFYAPLAWHRANYVLEDDEWYSPDGPAKMRDDQVRDGAGRLENMSPLPQFNDVAFYNYCSLLTLKDVPAGVASNHPARIPSQRARIEAFLARNAKAATKPRCRIADSDNDSVELELSGPLQLGQLTAASQDEGHAVSVLLNPIDLRKLAETATKIADRIEGKA